MNSRLGLVKGKVVRVPMRAESKEFGIIGDGIVELHEGDIGFKEWFLFFEKQQQEEEDPKFLSQEDFAEWDESKHLRGKSTAASRGGSFKPGQSSVKQWKDRILKAESVKLVDEFRQWMSKNFPHIQVINEADTVMFPSLMNKTFAELRELLQEYPEAAKYLEKIKITPLSSNWGQVDEYGTILNISSKMLSNPDVLKNGLITANQFHDGMTDVAHVARHEFGHVVDYWARNGRQHQILPEVRASGVGLLRDTHHLFLNEAGGWKGPEGDEWRVNKSSVARASDLLPISGYATTNSKEWFAETFAATKYGDKAAKEHVDVTRMIAYTGALKKAYKVKEIKLVTDLPHEERRSAWERARVLASAIGIDKDKI